MSAAQVFVGSGAVIGQKFFAFVEESPQFFEEAIDAVYAVGIPRFGLLQRTEEHFVETERIGTISGNDVIRVDYIEH